MVDQGPLFDMGQIFPIFWGDSNSLTHLSDHCIWICDTQTGIHVDSEDIHSLATALGASKVSSLVIKGALHMSSVSLSIAKGLRIFYE